MNRTANTEGVAMAATGNRPKVTANWCNGIGTINVVGEPTIKGRCSKKVFRDVLYGAGFKVNTMTTRKITQAGGDGE